MAQTFKNGDKVVMISDPNREVFTVSQTGETKCWIGDAQGCGWYVYYSDLKPADESEDEEDDE